MTFEQLCALAPDKCPICNTPKTKLQLGYEAKREMDQVVDFDFYQRKEACPTKETIEYTITLFCPNCKRLAQVLHVFGQDELAKMIQLAYAMFINRREKINGDFLPIEETLHNLQVVRFFNGAISKDA